MKSIFTSQKVSRRLVVFLLPLLLRFERLQEMLESWMIFERAVPLRNENPLLRGGQDTHCFLIISWACNRSGSPNLRPNHNPFFSPFLLSDFPMNSESSENPHFLAGEIQSASVSSSFTMSWRRGCGTGAVAGAATGAGADPAIGATTGASVSKKIGDIAYKYNHQSCSRLQLWSLKRIATWSRLLPHRRPWAGRLGWGWSV
jgi:hypothetical protein